MELEDARQEFFDILRLRTYGYRGFALKKAERYLLNLIEWIEELGRKDAAAEFVHAKEEEGRDNGYTPHGWTF